MQFSPSDMLRKSYHRGRYAIIKRMAGDAKKILDIGCGRPCSCMPDGSLLDYLGDGTGMDIKDVSMDHPFIKCDFQEVDTAGFAQGFDCIIASEVLEHVADPDACLLKVAKMLAPNGVFIMSTPNNSALWRIIWFFWERLIGREWKDSHEQHLSESEWLNLLSRHFRILDVKGYWGLLLIAKVEQKDDI